MFHRGLLVGLASPAFRDWGWESVFMFPCFQCQKALCPLWYAFNPLFCFCLCLLAFLLFFFFPCWQKCTEITPHHCVILFLQSLFLIYFDLRSIKRPTGNSLTTVTSAVVIIRRFWIQKKMKGQKKTYPSGTSSFFYFTHHLFWFALIKVCWIYWGSCGGHPKHLEGLAPLNLRWCLEAVFIMDVWHGAH